MFDWAMENMSIWASLDIESRNAKTLGRAYTCGVSNMGRYPFETQVRTFVRQRVQFWLCCYSTSRVSDGCDFVAGNNV